MGPVNYFVQFIEFSTIVSLIHTRIIMYYTLQAIMFKIREFNNFRKKKNDGCSNKKFMQSDPDIAVCNFMSTEETCANEFSPKRVTCIYFMQFHIS